MAEIKKVAVLGAGVMGAAIAAQAANGGAEVILLDMVPTDRETGEQVTEDRSRLAEGAIEKLLKAKPAPLSHPSHAGRITTGNYEDNMDLLGDVDLIIEAVLENTFVKRELFVKVDEHRKEGSVVASNTSTIPLKNLLEDVSMEELVSDLPSFINTPEFTPGELHKMPEGLKDDFMITHFFNPPRYMKLLEVVRGDVDEDRFEAVKEFADKIMGKAVLECNDTPGFLANRIGTVWFASAMKHAFDDGLTVEEVDAAMGNKATGIPKTGIFGLLDMVGIDLLPMLKASFEKTMDPNDKFLQLYEDREIITKMIKTEHTGLKGKGGFYKAPLDEEGRKYRYKNGKTLKVTKDLQTGKYAVEEKASFDSVKTAGDDFKKLVEGDDKASDYTWKVLRDVMHYAASLIPEISESISDVDTAMKLGYNWSKGPFELIDELGGPAVFAEKLREDGIDVPDLIANAGDKSLYSSDECQLLQLGHDGNYKEIATNPNSWNLASVKAHSQPISKNDSAAIWDVGDGVALLEIANKNTSIDPDVIAMISEAVERGTNGEFSGLIIGGDQENFAVGADIKLLYEKTQSQDPDKWNQIESMIKDGQDALMGLKYAPFPVVAAAAGKALGGGCEILLHSDAVQAHLETYPGLVEVGVGLIPGWGGNKELLIRNLEKGEGSVEETVKSLLMSIGTAQVSMSAHLAQSSLILNEKSGVTMNRNRLLADAKDKVLELAQDYTPPEPKTIDAPGKAVMIALEEEIAKFKNLGMAGPYDAVMLKAVATVLTAGGLPAGTEVTEQQLFDIERKVFMERIKDPASIERLGHMVKTNRPLMDKDNPVVQARVQAEAQGRSR